MPRRQIKIGPMDLTLKMDDRFARKITSHALYRSLVGPVLQSLNNRNRIPGDRESRVSSVEPKIEKKELTPEQKALYDQISGTNWYHSIDLGHGVITPGQFDHRPFVHLYGLPEDLNGKRALDVATFNGFWAFELEKRRAREVLTIDIEKCSDLDLAPRVRSGLSEEELNEESGDGFRIAKKILGSKVDRRIMSVYDLSPEAMGMFDFVFCSDLLLHLMNPMKALQRIHSVVADYALIADCFDPDLGVDDTVDQVRYAGGRKLCVWWFFSIGALKQMILDAGFSKVETVNTFEFGLQGSHEKLWHVVFRAAK